MAPGFLFISSTFAYQRQAVEFGAETRWQPPPAHSLPDANSLRPVRPKGWSPHVTSSFDLSKEDVTAWVQHHARVVVCPIVVLVDKAQTCGSW